MKTIFCLLVLAYAAGISYVHFNDIDMQNIFIKSNEKVAKAEQNISKKVAIKDKNVSKDKPKEDRKKEVVIPKDATVIEIPKVPKVEAKVPQVVTVGGNKLIDRRQEMLSMDMPVVKTEKKALDTNQTKKELSEVGLNKLGRVSAYLRGKLLSQDEVTKRLKEAGFEVVGIKKIDPKGDLTVVFFTSKEIKDAAKKSPFAAVLRVLIDKKNSQISITNPFYFQRAYLKDAFDEKSAKSILKSIHSQFEDLKDSKDKLKYTLLPKYQFMFGMPSYDDMITVASGKCEDLIKRAKKHLAFVQKIDDKKYLVGVNLWGGTQSFYLHTGVQNSLLLPYPVMIENGKAKMLDPKYYIALSYPMLKMSQFMKISAIPAQIEKQCRSVFK